MVFLTDIDNFCTVGNRNEYSTNVYKLCHFNVTTFSTLRGKTKNNTKTAARIQLIFPKFYRK